MSGMGQGGGPAGRAAQARWGIGARPGRVPGRFFDNKQHVRGERYGT